MNARKVCLLAVEGNREEFLDLIGTTGKLTPTSESIAFVPDDGKDWLFIKKKRQSIKKGKLRIVTELDNIFVFRLLEKPCNTK